jgi:hypothetical protein
MPSKTNAQRAPEIAREDDNRVDRGPTDVGIGIRNPVADE